MIELNTESDPDAPFTLLLVEPAPPAPTVTVMADPAVTEKPDAVRKPPAPPPPPNEPAPPPPPPATTRYSTLDVLLEADGVTLFEAALAGPVVKVVALTVNVYAVPFVSPVTVIGEVDPVAVMLPGEDVTV